MSNKDVNDKMIEQLYKQRKSNISVDKAINKQIVQSLTEADQQEQRLEQKYSHLGFFKVTAIALALLFLALPMFTFLKDEVTLINADENTYAQQQVEYVRLPEPVLANNNESLSIDTLQQFKAVQVPDSPATMTADVKISAFNQHIKQLLTDQLYDVSIDQKQYFANQIQQGRLLYENDQWFVQYCSKQRYLVSESIIKQSLAASPLLDKAVNGMLYDFYSNDTGLIAMLKQDDNQCK